MYVSPDGVPEVASPSGLDDLTRLGLAADDVVVDARQAQGPRQGVSIVGNQAYGVAAVPLLVRPSGRPQQVVGVLAVAIHLDDTYLRVRETGGEPLSFSLVAPAAVLAVIGRRNRRRASCSPRRSGRSPGPSAPPRWSTAGSWWPARSGAEAGPGAPAELAVVTTVPDRRGGRRARRAVPQPVRGRAARDPRVGRWSRAHGRAHRGRAAPPHHGHRAPAGRRPRRPGPACAATTSSACWARRSTRWPARCGRRPTSCAAPRPTRPGCGPVSRRCSPGMGEALLACDLDRSVTECNRAAADLLGVDPTAVRGRPIDDVVRFTPADRRETVRVAAPASGVAAYDGSVWTGSGPVPVHVTAGPLVGEDDRVTGAVFVLRDMRRERQAEQAKADLLATISHELRTPLTPIKGYAGMLRKRGGDPGQAERFARRDLRRRRPARAGDRPARELRDRLGRPARPRAGPGRGGGPGRRARSSGPGQRRGADRRWRREVTQGPAPIVRRPGSGSTRRSTSSSTTP